MWRVTITTVITAQRALTINAMILHQRRRMDASVLLVKASVVGWNTTQLRGLRSSRPATTGAKSKHRCAWSERLENSFSAVQNRDLCGEIKSADCYQGVCFLSRAKERYR